VAEVFVTEDAQADLDDIDLYSLREFGPVVADRYHADFLAAFDLIGESPRIGSVFRRRKPIVRSWPCGSHRIYYVFEGGAISIVRVLHMAMNQDRQMRETVRRLRDER
jgi:toxin ParE1/3/4